MNLPIVASIVQLQTMFTIIFEESFNCCIKTEITVLYLIRPPLKYCLFGIADPHYQQVGR